MVAHVDAGLGVPLPDHSGEQRPRAGGQAVDLVVLGEVRFQVFGEEGDVLQDSSRACLARIPGWMDSWGSYSWWMSFVTVFSSGVMFGRWLGS